MLKVLVGHATEIVQAPKLTIAAPDDEDTEMTATPSKSHGKSKETESALGQLRLSFFDAVSWRSE